MRIINESLHIRVKGNDPIYAYDTANDRFVYVRKDDWKRASPAISTIEACVILRITPRWFKTRREELGIEPKRTNFTKSRKDIPKMHAQWYYTIDDIVEVSRELPRAAKHDAADESEIRGLFARGFISYKRTRDGTLVPVWNETIY